MNISVDSKDLDALVADVERLRSQVIGLGITLNAVRSDKAIWMKRALDAEKNHKILHDEFDVMSDLFAQIGRLAERGYYGPEVEVR